MPICFIMRHHKPPTSSPFHPNHKPPISSPSHPNHKPPTSSPTNLTNHTPLTNCPYQPLALHVNVGSQPHTFPNPLNHAQVTPFPPSIILVPIIAHNQTPQPTFTSSTHLQPLSKVSCSTCGHQFTNRRLFCYQHSC
jgi:hypothetical protein